MTVFVVNPTRDDLTPALRYGELRYINMDYVFSDLLTDEGDIPRDFNDNLHRCADEFNPDKDYLLIVGDHLQIVAFATMLSARHRWFRVLRFDRIEKAYTPVRLSGLALVK